MMNTRLSITVSIAIAAMLADSAWAQTPGALDQTDKVQQQRERSQTVTAGDGEAAPELFSGESSDVGPQSVLRVKPRRTWFEAQADVQYFYTDNMFLTENNEVDTAVLLSTVQFAVAPTPFETESGRLGPRIGYRHQWFSFGLDGEELPFTTTELSEFDFNVSTVFADLTWICGNWRAQLGFDYQRLLDTSDYDEFYREYVPRWLVQYTWPLTERSAVAVGYDGNIRFTDADVFAFPDFNDRTDHAVFVNYTLALCPQAVVQPFYRFKYTHFTDYFPGQDRDDALHSFGVGLYWLVCPNFNVRAFAGYDVKCSDNDLAPDYQRLDLGGGVNLNFRF
jgi:hypothetical protein